MKHLILTVLASLTLSAPALAGDKGKESAYDRVMRTGTIRCGYVVWSPYLLKDPNTGAFSGLAFEIMQDVAKELDVKIEWAQEVGWGDFHEALNSDKVDMMCVPVWQSGQRAKIALLTNPVYYIGLYAFAKESEMRFDHGFEAINNPAVTVAVVDGDATQAVRKIKFSNAKELAAPQFADSAQVMMNVATGKADVGLENPSLIKKFNEASKEKLKMVADGKPLRLFGNVFALKKGEYEFEHILNATIGALNASGTLDVIAQKYAPEVIAIAPDYKE